MATHAGAFGSSNEGLVVCRMRKEGLCFGKEGEEEGDLLAFLEGIVRCDDRCTGYSWSGVGVGKGGGGMADGVPMRQEGCKERRGFTRRALASDQLPSRKDLPRPTHHPLAGQSQKTVNKIIHNFGVPNSHFSFSHQMCEDR